MLSCCSYFGDMIVFPSREEILIPPFLSTYCSIVQYYRSLNVWKSIRKRQRKMSLALNNSVCLVAKRYDIEKKDRKQSLSHPFFYFVKTFSLCFLKAKKTIFLQIKTFSLLIQTFFPYKNTQISLIKKYYLVKLKTFYL